MSSASQPQNLTSLFQIHRPPGQLAYVPSEVYVPPKDLMGLYEAYTVACLYQGRQMLPPELFLDYYQVFTI